MALAMVRFRPRFSCLKSRRKAVVSSILLIQIGEEIGDAVERIEFALARFSHCGHGRGLGTLTSKGRAFSVATRASRTRAVRDGYPHGRQRLKTARRRER